MMVQKQTPIPKIQKFNYLFGIFLFIPIAVIAQRDTLLQQRKTDVFSTLERQAQIIEAKEEGKTNFDRWSYSKKKHAVVGYLGSIAQGGFSDGLSTSNWHYDLGAMYRGKLVNTKAYKLNVHAWVEHTNLVAGSDPKQFARDLNMFSAPNASDATEAGFGLEYLLLENFFFDGFWDVTIGKLEPLFYITFADYSGWDKLTFFSKTAASDPVPDVDGGFGVFTEFNFTDNFSIGGQIHDDNPRNEYFDPANFFQNTTYAYQSFVRFAIPNTKGYYSYHILSYYSQEASENRPSGEGWLYVGNQGISERVVLTLKLSNGSGRILKYNGAYSAGMVLLSPFNRAGDQFGAAFQINELGGSYEYGLDTYYKWFLQDWITVSANMQGYITQNDKFAFIPGIRAMITY